MERRSHTALSKHGKTAPCCQRGSCIACLTAILFLLLFVLPARTVLAQRTDLQSWTQILAIVPLHSERRWFTVIDLQPRIGNNVSALERLFIRPGIGYNINARVAIAMGYAWTPSYINTSYEHDFRDENRIWQTIAYSHQAWGLTWQHRFRQEQRFIQGASGTSHRSQYLLRGSYPLPELPDWGLTSSGQILVNENSVDRGPRAGLDRTRMFFGPFFISGSVRYELGYLAEYAPRFGEDSRVIHALMLSAQLSL